MAVAHVNTTSNSSTTASTTHSITMPTFSQDDLVVLILTATAGSVDPMGSYSAAGGWTEVPGVVGGVNVTSVSAVRLQAFYRLMQSGDPGSVNFTQGTSSGFKAIASSYSGVDLTTPINIAASSIGGANTSAVCPTVTTDEDNAWVLRIATSDDNETFANAGVTVRQNTGGIDTPGNGVNSASGDEIQVSQGVTGTSTWTLGASEEWGTFTVAINPVLVTFELTGVTRNEAALPLGSCLVHLFKHNEAGDSRSQVGSSITSNASTGVYLFTGIPDNDSDYVVMAFKDDTPHVFGITDRTLTPESNPASTDFDVCLRSDVDKGEISVDNDLRLWDQIKVTGSAPFFGANF